MLERATYTTKPEPIHYMPLPTGEADVWLRKHIEETTDPETEQVIYEADEAYIRTTATLVEVTANFEGFYETAAAWQPLLIQKKRRAQEETVDGEEYTKG